jgi:hypothetical protein
MPRTLRGFLPLLLVAAIALPQFGCGESPTDIPEKTPPPPAKNDPGPATAFPTKKAT